MRSFTNPMITAALILLLASPQASLTPPDERKFEPLATERFSDDTRHPGDGLFFMAIVTIILWAAMIGYFLNA